MEAPPHKAQGRSPLVPRSHRPRCPWWKGLKQTRIAWVTAPPPGHRERQTLLLLVTSPLTVTVITSPLLLTMGCLSWGRRAGHGLGTRRPGCVVNASRLGTHCVSAGP